MDGPDSTEWVQQQPDWPMWAQRRIWTLIEAACLLSGWEPPDNFDTAAIAKLVRTRPISDRYADLKAAIELNEIAAHSSRIVIDGRVMVYGQRVESAKFIAWAASRKHPVPKELVGLVPQEEAPQEEARPAQADGNDKIPGKLPRNAIGKLAVTAAWKIECETGRRASAKEVMGRLQEWADDGAEADVLRKSDRENRRVYWLTSKSEEKDYTLGACQKTLGTWNLSRE